MAIQLFLLVYFFSLVCTLFVTRRASFFPTYIHDMSDKKKKRSTSECYFECMIINELVDIEGSVKVVLCSDSEGLWM